MTEVSKKPIGKFAVVVATLGLAQAFYIWEGVDRGKSSALPRRYTTPKGAVVDGTLGPG